MSRFVLGAFLFTSLAYAQPDGDWQTYRNTAGGYEVAFPIKPAVQVIQPPTGTGVQAQLTSVKAEGLFMGVLYAPASGSDQTNFVGGFLNSFAKGGKILRQDNIKFHNEPAQIVILDEGKSCMELLVFRRAKTVVIALATAKDAKGLGAKHFFQFFDSLKLLPAK